MFAFDHGVLLVIYWLRKVTFGTLIPNEARQLGSAPIGLASPNASGSNQTRCLGRLNSNRRMSNSKMAFEMSAEFPLISERLRTRD
jgi:hypothetical protein